MANEKEEFLSSLSQWVSEEVARLNKEIADVTARFVARGGVAGLVGDVVTEFEDDVAADLGL